MKSVYVAFSGSGMLAPTELGALSALVQLGYNPKVLCGTSGGAVICSLYACHPDTSMLTNLVKTMDWVPLMDFRRGLFTIERNAWRFAMHQGWCDPNPLHRFLFEQTAYATFADLDIDLRITATDLQSGTLKVFSRAQTPHMHVADAVRASTSIPFVYPPMDINGRAYVDGGVTRDIPADLLPNDGTQALCVYLTGPRKATAYPHRIYQVASQTINALLSGQHALDMESAKWVKCISVNTGTLDALDASMTVPERERLIELGRKAVVGAL